MQGCDRIRFLYSYRLTIIAIVILLFLQTTQNAIQGRKIPQFFTKQITKGVTGATKWIKRIVNDQDKVQNSNLFGNLKYAWVDTSVGRLKGFKGKSRLGKTFIEFRGIPYAIPPVGDLRFEPPIPHPGWNGERSATDFGPECLQVDLVSSIVVGDENCLHLNVYTRRAYLWNEKPESTRPVIVFIHGGLFMTGSSNIYLPKYFMDEDIVLITINYRVTSFGFLNTMDGLINGNMGLKDQVLALQWVQTNVKFFNGDPRRVTIMGQSAGAVSVHLHTMSPMSKGLFVAAISQSGTAFSAWAQVDQPAYQALEFAADLGCPTDDSQKMVFCLKSLPAKTIAESHIGFTFKAAKGKRSMFGPTVETNHPGPKFLPYHPITLFKNNWVQDVPWLCGVNNGDGLVYLLPILRNETIRRFVNKNWYTTVPMFLGYQHLPNAVEVSTIIKRDLLKNQPISHSNVKQVARIISDRAFFLDSHDAAILQSRVAPVYSYYYTYNGLLSLGNLLFRPTNLPVPKNVNNLLGTGINWFKTNMLEIYRESDVGVSHGDELVHFFNIPFIRKEIDWHDRDYAFSRKVIKLWVSFAELGYPDTRVAGENVIWETVRQTNPNLLDIPIKRLKLDKTFSLWYEDVDFSNGINFWKYYNISYINQVYSHPSGS